MGKTANEIEQEKAARIKNISSMLNYDIESTRNRIVAEAVKISAKRKGIIDISNQDFQEMKNTLINGDASRSSGGFNVDTLQKSVLEKIEDTTKKIKAENPEAQKLADLRAIDASEFKGVKDNLDNVIKSLNKFNTNEGVKEVISDYLKNELSQKTPFWKFDNEKQPVTLSPSEKQDIAGKIKSYVKLPDDMQPILREGLEIVDKKLAPIVSEAMGKHFSTDKSKDTKVLIYDPQKLTPDNLQKFGQEVTEKIGQLTQKLAKKHQIKDEIIGNTISSLENNKKFKFNDELKEKIQEKLSQALDKFDSKYLKARSNDISEGIAKDLADKRSFALFSKHFKISENSLNKVIENITRDYEENSKTKEFRPVNPRSQAQINRNLSSSPKAIRKISMKSLITQKPPLAYNNQQNKNLEALKSEKNNQTTALKEKYNITTSKTPHAVNSLPPLPPRNSNKINSVDANNVNSPTSPKNNNNINPTIKAGSPSIPRSSNNVGSTPPPLPKRNNMAASPSVSQPQPLEAQEALGRGVAKYNSPSGLNGPNSKLRQELALNGNILHQHGARTPEKAKGKPHSPPVVKNNNQNAGKKNTMTP